MWPKENWVEELQKMNVFSSDSSLLMKLKAITCFLRWEWHKEEKILVILKQKERKSYDYCKVISLEDGKGNWIVNGDRESGGKQKLKIVRKI